jgi:polysaccharide transporter, PST family
MRPESLIKNGSSLLAIQIANQLLPLITIPYLTHTLGIEAYGAYAFAIAIVTLACVVTDFGFNLWATAEVATHRDNTEWINQLFGSVTVVKFLLTIVVLIGIFIYASNSHISIGYRNVLYWVALPIIGLTFQPLWLFNGLERMAYITVFILVSRLVFVALTFTLVTSTNDLTLLMLINGLAQIIAALLGFGILVRSGYVPTRPQLSSCQAVLKQASPFFLSRVAVSTYTAGGALFLGIFSGINSVAIYAVAEQLYRGALSLLSPVSQVMYPYILRTQRYKVLMQVTATATAIACIGSILGALLGEKVILFLFGKDFMDSADVLNIFLLAIIVNTPSVLLGYPMLGALGLLHLANRSVLIAGGLQAILLFGFFILNYTNPVHVAIAVLVAEFSVLALRAVWCAHAWRRSKPSIE